MHPPSNQNMKINNPLTIPEECKFYVTAPMHENKPTQK